MEQFEEVEVVKALKKHTDTMRELTDQQYKASKALDVLFKYKTNKLNVNTTRDIDDFTGKTLGVPFLSEQLINSLGDVLQKNKEAIEKQLETYVKKLDMDLSTGTFEQHEGGMSLAIDGKGLGYVIANAHAASNELAKQALEEAKLNSYAFNEPHKMAESTSKKDEEFKKLQKEHNKLKHMYKIDTQSLFKQIEELTQEKGMVVNQKDGLNNYIAAKDEKYKKLQEEHESTKNENEKMYDVVATKNKELEKLKSKYNILNDNFMKYKSSN